MMDGWGSHMPYLAAMVLKTTGPILECGAGYYSTPLLHYLCKVHNRELLTLEGEYNWLVNFTQYQSSFHKLEHIQDWNNHPALQKQWGLVLIDHSPALQRKETIKQMQDNVDFFVIHDSEADSVYHYSEIFPLFKYRFDYVEYRPWTTILSKKYDCTI